jgi:hypothetical protein
LSSSAQVGARAAAAEAEDEARDQRDAAREAEDERLGGLDQGDLVPPLLSSATIWLRLAGVAVGSAS